MRTYSDMASHRLQDLARREGVDCEIKVSEAQQEARYFVVALDEEPLLQPVPLGFTEYQAAHAIKGHRWERFALRGAATRLGPVKASRRPVHPG